MFRKKERKKYLGKIDYLINKKKKRIRLFVDFQFKDILRFAVAKGSQFFTNLFFLFFQARYFELGFKTFFRFTNKLIVKTILFLRKKNKIIGNKIFTIIFDVQIRIWRIDVRTILGKIIIIGAYTRSTFIQDSINKLVSTSDIGSWNSFLWYNEKK